MKLELTPLEASALLLVAGNGWGDGDFAGWLNNPSQARACVRAMGKLRAAIEQAKDRGHPDRGQIRSK